ncbi:MAG TPA: hypothetical protein VK675_03030 [Candidatus Paceibacterota bacterium]|nr:hypothetical protein [Candidatus Paceibacterota bacterium]
MSKQDQNQACPSGQNAAGSANVFGILNNWRVIAEDPLNQKVVVITTTNGMPMMADADTGGIETTKLIAESKGPIVLIRWAGKEEVSEEIMHSFSFPNLEAFLKHCQDEIRQAEEDRMNARESYVIDPPVTEHELLGE